MPSGQAKKGRISHFIALGTKTYCKRNNFFNYSEFEHPVYRPV